MTKKKNAMQTWLSEPINYGGEILPRGEVIRLMKDAGADAQRIGLWFMGYERGLKVRGQKYWTPA